MFSFIHTRSTLTAGGRQSMRRRCLSAILLVTVLITMWLVGCKSNSETENAEFEAFTRELFCSEVASNTVSLHYTLQNPEDYQIKDADVTFGSFSTDVSAASAGIENLSAALEQFSYDLLERENQLTYDVIQSYLATSEKGVPYLLYSEPMNSVSGVQTQVPVLLSEYSFYDAEDVDTYLELMTKVPEYFNSLIAFENAKSQAGLFMPETLAETALNQCQAFVDMGESNYLISTFVDRIKQMDSLSDEEMDAYIQKNAEYLEDYVIPAYETLITEITKLKGTGTNEEGLCNLPDGKAYYEFVVEQETGSSRSVAEMQELTKKQILSDLQAMEEVLGITGYTQETVAGAVVNAEDYSLAEDKLTAETSGESEQSRQGEEAEETDAQAAVQGSQAAAGAVLMLTDLEEKISGSFPAPPQTSTQVKCVPEAMQEHLSPAFYMIPEIDNITENVIYINEGYIRDDLSMFTTLAHEGYPGHLYQTTYYAAREPDPVRNIFNFGGYVEGWATYAEMCSYYLTDLPKEQATLLQKNASIILGLYALADMGIQYDGWSRMDAVQFFSAYGIMDTSTVNRIYDLILGDPGNYLKYYIGYLEFLELKKEYAARAGDIFSQEDFHKGVLDVGPAPFDVVRKYAW